MTGWSIALAIVSAVLALTGIGLTVASYFDARREMAKRSTLADVERIRELIGEFVVGAVALVSGGTRASKATLHT